MYMAMYNTSMAQMVRKQVYLEPRHDRMLKRSAKRRGVTEATLIRESLDGVQYGTSYAWHPREHNVDAARQAVAFMRSLPKKRTRDKSERAWTREDLYEARVGRWSKS